MNYSNIKENFHHGYFTFYRREFNFSEFEHIDSFFNKSYYLGIKVVYSLKSFLKDGLFELINLDNTHHNDYFIFITTDKIFYKYMNFYNSYLLFSYERITFFCRLFISHMVFYHRITFFDVIRLVSVFKSCVCNLVKKFVPILYLERIKCSIDDLVNFCVSIFCCILSNYHIQKFFFNIAVDDKRTYMLKNCKMVFLDVLCFIFDSHKRSDVC